MMPPVKNPPKKEIAQIIIQITATVHRMFAMLKVFWLKMYCFKCIQYPARKLILIHPQYLVLKFNQ